MTSWEYPRLPAGCDGDARGGDCSCQVAGVGRLVCGASSAGDDHVEVERAQGLSVGQVGVQCFPADRVEGGRMGASGQADGSLSPVDVADGQLTDLLVGSGVHECQQPDQPFVRVGGVLGPAAEQPALAVDVDDGAVETWLPTGP